MIQPCGDIVEWWHKMHVSQTLVEGSIRHLEEATSKGRILQALEELMERWDSIEILGEDPALDPDVVKADLPS